MKNKLTIISRVGLLLSSSDRLVFAGSAMAQHRYAATRRPAQNSFDAMETAVKSKSNITNKQQASAVSAQDKLSMQKAATGGNMKYNGANGRAEWTSADVKKFGNRMWPIIPGE